MNEQKVKLVMGLDGRPTGEAYVEISGPGAKYRLALAKDRQLMPVQYPPPAIFMLPIVIARGWPFACMSQDAIFNPCDHSHTCYLLLHCECSSKCSCIATAAIS